MIAAGSLRDRAAFQRQAAIDDGLGNVTGDWATYLTVWADLTEAPGRAEEEAGAYQGLRRAEMRIRQSPESVQITDADRVLCRGTLWQIETISQPGRIPDTLHLTLIDRRFADA